MKIRPVGADLLNADGQTDGKTDRQTWRVTFKSAIPIELHTIVKTDRVSQTQLVITLLLRRFIDIAYLKINMFRPFF